MKIGIITMHKVLNYGSVLQAYALQQKLFKLGYDNELIDYKYPKAVKKIITFGIIINEIVIFLRNVIIGFPTERKKLKFKKFYERNFVLSPKAYDENNINNEIPIYDVYITGSDQVWNPRFAGNDTNFMLSFAPDDKLKFSYASSFATKSIEEDKKRLYKTYLERYNFISVRESSGINIIKEIINKEAQICCDPTLLLDKSDWNKLADQSKLHINYKYILVYPLVYMFNPYPDIYKIVDKIQKELGYKVIYLVGRKEDAFRPNSKLIKSAGPEDFVYLFKNAEFVITTSFHGTAFSLIYEKPLIGIVKKENDNDSRIQSLLCQFGAEKSIFDINDNLQLDKNSLILLKGKKENGNIYIKESNEYLINALKTK